MPPLRLFRLAIEPFSYPRSRLHDKAKWGRILARLVPNDQGLLVTPLGPFLVKHKVLSTVGLGLMKKLPL